MSDFFQEGPRLGNQFEDDAVLRGWLQWRLPAEIRSEIEPQLRTLGARAATELLALSEAAEREPPRHVPYDPWGRRVDEIVTSDAWRALDRIAAEEGLIAIGYERAHGAYSRTDQLARLYLYHPSSATYSCPLAMTDGAARLLELYPDEVTRPVFAHLTSRTSDRFWTSGQWMTERTGGSDVASTTTTACPSGNAPGEYLLSGTKWFTSATTAQVAITLARIDGAPAGSRGLSVFLVQLRDPSGALRGVCVNRLKDKLGTRALPTAELTLDHMPGHLVGGAGDGVRKISALFNITRVYNAVAAVAGMRRAIALARDYATRRVAFGRPLIDQPLHAETLAKLEVEHRAALHLTFRVVELLGRQECGTATAAELALLRLLIPVAKLYTGKRAVAVASEALEAFGGAGYIEDTTLPRLLRDAQVLPIWEGTTNVLSLDVLRAVEKADALAVWLAEVRERVGAVRLDALDAPVARLTDAAQCIERHAETAAAESSEYRQAGARAFAYALARTYAGSLLVAHAEWCVRNNQAAAPAALAAARRWAARPLAPLAHSDAAHRAESAWLIGRGGRSEG
ncbi:MAG TPA: acyl-CoA dehydrogenase family protein [Gemmatimonadaceae bacterium]|nr:acyl-CoA dehydrogenase family protein [Gemmatimonadaceae bacterium]